MGLAAHVSPETLTSFDEKAGAVARNTPRNRRLSGDSWRARAASHSDKKFRDISRAVRVPKEHRGELLTRTLQISSAKNSSDVATGTFSFSFFFFFLFSGSHITLLQKMLQTLIEKEFLLSWVNSFCCRFKSHLLHIR